MASREGCATLPTTTCPTSSGATFACSRAALPATTARSVAERSLSVPPKVPKGVRLAARKTISVLVAYFIGFGPLSKEELPERHRAPHQRGGGEEEAANRLAAQIRAPRSAGKEALRRVHEGPEVAGRRLGAASRHPLHLAPVGGVDLRRARAGKAAGQKIPAFDAGKGMVGGEDETTPPRLRQEVEPRLPPHGKGDRPVAVRLVEKDRVLLRPREGPTLRHPPRRGETQLPQLPSEQADRRMLQPRRRIHGEADGARPDEVHEAAEISRHHQAEKAEDEQDPQRVDVHVVAILRTCARTKSPTWRVVLSPPASGVRQFSATAASTARSTILASSSQPRCSSISAQVRKVAIGLAFPWPAMSGALPCTGSKRPI